MIVFHVKGQSHRTISHPPGGRLPLLSARPAVTFPAAEHHWRCHTVMLYCSVILWYYTAWLPKIVTQLLPRVGFEPTTCWCQVQCSTCCTTYYLTRDVVQAFFQGRGQGWGRTVTKQYNLVPANGRWCSAAGKVTTGLAESIGSLPPGGW